jgi:hypothetical protein
MSQRTYVSRLEKELKAETDRRLQLEQEINKYRELQEIAAKLALNSN